MARKFATFICLLLVVCFVGVQSVTGPKIQSVFDILDYYKDTVDASKTSERCERQKDAYFNGLMNRDEWAWDMIDATGKIASAIRRGNPDDYGYYDQCVGINAQLEDDTIRGKYCYFGIIIPWEILFSLIPISANTSASQRNEPIARSPILPDAFVPRFKDFPRMSYKKDGSKEVSTRVDQMHPGEDFLKYYGMAFCVPDACVPSDIVGEVGQDSYCETQGENKNLEADDIACIVFLVVFACFLIGSTAYDLHLEKHGKKPIHPIFVAFSVYSNGKKILKTVETGTPGQILCFHGMKAISLFWVIAGHTYSAKQSQGLINLLDTYVWMEKWYAAYMLQAPLAVDTFLFLSGVLLSYNFIKSMSKPKARFNIFLYYLHRYLRLTPALAATYFVSITLLRKLGSGPIWAAGFELLRKPCLDYWWAFFLYVQNYVTVDDMCLVPTWYLSVDMQLFIISPLILLPLVHFRKYFIRVGFPILLFLSILSPFLVIYLNDVAFWNDDYYNLYYYVTHTRVGPWIVGLMFGVYLLKNEGKEFKIGRVTNLLYWLIDLALIGAIFFTQTDLAFHPEKLKSAFYLSLIRPGFAICLCWIVFACQKGYAGFINTFLSMPIFQIISKISYSTYVVHFTYIYAVGAYRRTKTYYSDFENLNDIIHNIFYAMVIGTLWTLAFESPMIIIERILFGGGGSKRPKKVENTENNNEQPTTVQVSEEANGEKTKV